MPVSSRAFTDSFCSMLFPLKCFPTSRRKSTRLCLTSQSALLRTRACSGPSKSRSRAIWSRWRCRCPRICSFESNGRSLRLPLGSPIRPVPPPIHDGLVAGELEMPQQHDRHEIAELQAGCGRIEAAVHRAMLGREVRPDLLRGVVDETAPLELREEVRHGAESYGKPPPLASAERPH